MKKPKHIVIAALLLITLLIIFGCNNKFYKGDEDVKKYTDTQLTEMMEQSFELGYRKSYNRVLIDKLNGIESYEIDIDSIFNIDSIWYHEILQSTIKTE